jgi:hypothetical protein
MPSALTVSTWTQPAAAAPVAHTVTEVGLQRPEPEPAAPPRYEPAVEPRQTTAPALPQPEPLAYRAPALVQAYTIPPDMVQVETTHAAVPAEPDVQAESQPRRVRRPRPEETAVESEPLVQVETRSATSGSE